MLPPKLTTLKLYMPLTADFYERSEYGDLEPESTMLDGCALRGYQDQIMAELVKNRMPDDDVTTQWAFEQIYSFVVPNVREECLIPSASAIT